MADAGPDSLQQLLMGDLAQTTAFDIANELGIGQHGQPGDEWRNVGLSPLQRLPMGLTPQPPLSAAGLGLPPPPSLSAAPAAQLPPSLLQQRQSDRAALQAANEAVAACLQAAEAATVALRLTGLQLEQWSAPEPLSPGTAAPTGDAAADSFGSPAAAAAAAGAALGEGKPEPATSRGSGGEAASAAVPKRKRGGSRGAAAASAPGPSATPLAAADGGAAAAAAAARQQGPGKGLRHFSLKVCEKVESKGNTTYEEVANELIADMAAEVAAGLVEQVHDEKNIRRRVYDALNVLEAIGMINKTKKAIQWQGWPSGLGRTSEERLRVDRVKVRESLEAKREALQDAVAKAYCLSNLVLRNGEAPLPLLAEMSAAGVAVPNPLTLPFMLADQEAEVEVHISENNLHAHIDFQHWPFTLYDDDHVMRMLQLHLPQPQLYTSLGTAQPLGLQQRQQQQMPPPPQQQMLPERQQRQHAVPHLQPQQGRPVQQQLPGVKLEPGAAAPPYSGPMQQHGRPPAPDVQCPLQQLAPPLGRLWHEQSEPAQLAGPPVGGTPPKAAHRHTAALELSPDLGSPAGLGSGVSAMGLGSPPASAVRPPPPAASDALASREAAPLLRHAAGPAAEPLASRGIGGRGGATAMAMLSAGLPPPGPAPGAGPHQQPHMWSQWLSATVGPPLLPGGHPAPSPPQYHTPAQLGAPQLRPASAETVQLGLQQQRQQQAQVLVPVLRPARRQ